MTPDTKPTIADLLQRARSYNGNSTPAGRIEALTHVITAVEMLAESDRRVLTTGEIAEKSRAIAVTAARWDPDSIVDAVVELAHLVEALAPVLGRDGEPDERPVTSLPQDYTTAIRAHHGIGRAEPEPAITHAIRFNLHESPDVRPWSATPFTGHDMMVEYSGDVMFARWDQDDQAWSIRGIGQVEQHAPGQWPQGCTFMRWDHADPTPSPAAVASASVKDDILWELLSTHGVTDMGAALETLGRKAKEIETLHERVERANRRAVAAERRLESDENAPLAWVETDWREFYEAAGIGANTPLTPVELMRAAIADGGQWREEAGRLQTELRELSAEAERLRQQRNDAEDDASRWRAEAERLSLLIAAERERDTGAESAPDGADIDNDDELVALDYQPEGYAVIDAERPAGEWIAIFPGAGEARAYAWQRHHVPDADDGTIHAATVVKLRPVGNRLVWRNDNECSDVIPWDDNATAPVLQLAADLVRARLAPSSSEPQPERCGCDSMAWLERRLVDGVAIMFDNNRRREQAERDLQAILKLLGESRFEYAQNMLRIVRAMLDEAIDNDSLVLQVEQAASALVLRTRGARPGRAMLAEIGRLASEWVPF